MQKVNVDKSENNLMIEIKLLSIFIYLATNVAFDGWISWLWRS